MDYIPSPLRNLRLLVDLEDRSLRYLFRGEVIRRLAMDIEFGPRLADQGQNSRIWCSIAERSAVSVIMKCPCPSQEPRQSTAALTMSAPTPAKITSSPHFRISRSASILAN